MTQFYDQVLAPLELRATQYSLLSRVADLGPIALNPLAEILVMDRTTLGHNLRPLEARQLLQLNVGSDRRSREVVLTAAGRSLLPQAEELWRRAQAIYESKIGLGDAAILRDLLRRVAVVNFEGQDLR